MFTIGRYWQDSNGDGLVLSSNNAADLMRRELGIEKRHYAAKRSLEVLEDPKKALEDYKDDLDIISERMSTQFSNDLNDLLEIGYSPQQAERLALNKAEGWIEHQMAILDKKFPLVNDQALLRDTIANKAVIKVEGIAQKKQGGSGKSKSRGRVKLAVEVEREHLKSLNQFPVRKFSSQICRKPLTNKIITILFFFAQLYRKCIYLLVTSMNYLMPQIMSRRC
jgi:hypothetical protein